MCWSTCRRQLCVDHLRADQLIVAGMCFMRSSDSTIVGHQLWNIQELLTPSVAAGAFVVSVCRAGTFSVNSVVTGRLVVGNGATKSETGCAKSAAGLGAADVRCAYSTYSASSVSISSWKRLQWE